MSTPGNSFLRLPPVVAEPKDFAKVWICNAASAYPRCQEHHPHTGFRCGVVYRYELTEAQYIAWTEDRDKARRRYHRNVDLEG